jgi:uncharacterized protein YbaP (TraB family)
MIKFYLSQSSAFSFPVFLKRLSTVALLLLCIAPAIAQQQHPKDYNLLWRISGKGLTQPSYLFGTMHVKDKRAFGFSDSVMLAIKNTSAFALEVQPDTLIKTMFNQLGSRDSLRSLRKWLSPAEYAKLAKRFKQKKGYDMGNIDPMSLEAAMRPEYDKPGDKTAVVDAYLYGVAQGLGKNIYGLENTTEQFDSYFGLRSNIKERVKDLVDEDKVSDVKYLDAIETMIRLYSAGNLDNMKAFMSDEQLNDNELIARNKVMFNSIINRIPNQTMFSAVGAAHLPGGHGLIALLRNAGYTVTPVKADFTGVADKFDTDFTKLNWKTYKYENDGFSINLPFAPVKANIFYEMPTVVYADIANEAFMGVYSTKMGSGLKPVDVEKVFSNMTANFKKKSQDHVLSQNTITIKGHKVREFVIQANGQTLRTRIMVVNDYLYMVYAGLKPSTIHSPYINKFFDSFETFKPAPKSNLAWVTYKNDTAAFSVHLPGNPKLLLKELPSSQDSLGEPYRIHLFMAVDTNNIENYIIRYNDYPKGTYLADRKALFENMNQLFGNATKIINAPHKIIKEGYEGLEEDVLMAEKYFCKIQLLVRGNRTYVLVRQNLQAGAKDDKTNDDFFESFKLLPYSKPVMDQYNVNGGNFTAGVFQKTKNIIDSNYTSAFGNSVTTYSTNIASGGLYGIEHARISGYYRAKSVDSIFHFVTNKRIKYTDTLLKDDTITVNGVKGHEFITQNKENGTRKRNRILVDNGDMFYLTGYLAEEELFNGTSNAFFNSVKKVKPTDTIDMHSSKAEKIVDGLLSADTTTSKYANGALSYYDFEKDELPFIYKAIEKPYANDSTYEGTAHKLIQVLRSTHDDKTIGVLASAYKNPQINANVKPVILSAIAAIDKQKGYDIYLDLLTNVPTPKTKYIFSSFNPLSDSLDYVAANYNRIIPLLKNEKNRSGLLNVFQLMAANKRGKYDNFIRNHFNDITANANDDADRFLNKKDSTGQEMYMPVYYYLSLMQKVKGQAVTAGFTAKLIKQNDLDKHLPTAVITRIKNHLPVADIVLNRLLDSIDQRYDLMEALNKEKLLTRVPAKYKTQVAFAKLCLYQNVVTNEDGEAPLQMKLLGTVADKGEVFYVFNYKTYYDEDGSSQLGISGPYTPGSTKLDFTSYHVYSEAAEKGTGWQKQAKKMVSELRKQNEQELATATAK